MSGRAQRCLRYLWPVPYTIFGIMIGLLLGGRFRTVEGVVEIYGDSIAAALDRLPIRALAMTLGHVVLARSADALERTREHERVHVRQYERWGIAFVPAYFSESLWLYARGRDGYRENHFEVEAYACELPLPARRGRV